MIDNKSNLEAKYADLTAQQQQVINHKSGNLLVSASAGSGKTKVLITKIVDIILNKYATLKQLLVVTFTNDASTEMKIRLANELQKSNDSFLREQLDDLSTSDILTFDKFCIKVVREYGYQIGITNNFGIADDSLSKFLQSKALDNIFMQQNKNLDIKYESLLEQFFGKRNFSDLKNSIIKVFNFLNSKSINNNHYKTLLNDIYSNELNKSKAVIYLNNQILAKRDNFSCKLNDLKISAEQLGSEYLCNILVDWLQKIKVLNDDFENNYNTICNGFNFSKLTNKKLTADETDLKTLMAKYKEEFNKELSKYIENKSILLSNIKTDMLTTKQNLLAFYDLVDEFDKEYSKLKNRYQVLDFADLEKYAGRLLQDKKIKTALQNKYKFIFVDEYQDTNEIQDEILKNISTGENILMVGDVKQSIYRFRQAEPKIFLNKYYLYKDFQNANSIVELNKNFRSESDILNFANFVFDGIMQKDNSGVDYKNTARLEFGGNMKKSSSSEQIKIIAVNKIKKQENIKIEPFKYYSVKDAELTFGEYTKVQKEAKIVATEILSMLGQTYFDAKSNAYKKVDFKDITILSRKKSGVITLVKDILNKAGIPVNCTYKTKLYDSYDMQIVLNILRLLQNCQNDTALISTLCLFSNGLSFDDLAKIRATYKTEKFYYQAVDKYINKVEDDISQKIKNCFNKLNGYKTQSNNKDLCELIMHIVQNENLEHYFTVNNYGEEFNNHLSLLLNSIKSIKNYSLSEFINYVDTFAQSITYDVIIKDSNNSVQINTIHSSKGLEYPVVFLIDTGSRFSAQSTKENILTENDFGISTKSFNLQKRFVYNSPVNIGFKKKIVDEERKEEMRLLYVALTRPKNFLTIIGTTDLSQIKKIKNSQDVLEIDSYLKWILGLFEQKEINTLLDNKQLIKDCCGTKVSLKTYDFDDINVEQKPILKNQSFDGEFNNNFNQIIGKKFDKNNLVKKNSVSQIMAEEVHYNITDFTTKTTDKNNDDDFLLIGTVYHKFMQLVDFTTDQANILNQLQNLKQNGSLSSQDFAIADIDKITNAIIHMANYLTEQDTVLKEQQFICYMPANSLIKTNHTNKILVQGVADLIIIKQNEIYLIDYKTSRINNEDKFKQKYKTQLEIYAKAIESFFNKKVTKKIIYSFYLDKPIII